MSIAEITSKTGGTIAPGDRTKINKTAPIDRGTGKKIGVIVKKILPSGKELDKKIALSVKKHVKKIALGAYLNDKKPAANGLTVVGTSLENAGTILTAGVGGIVGIVGITGQEMLSGMVLVTLLFPCPSNMLLSTLTTVITTTTTGFISSLKGLPMWLFPPPEVQRFQHSHRTASPSMT
jgi:hypothetical protein